MSLFSKRKEITQEEMNEILNRIDNSYLISVKKIVGFVRQRYPDADKSLLKFETGVFIYSRSAIFLVQIGMNNDQFVNWLKNKIDTHLLSINDYLDRHVNIRMEKYIKIANSIKPNKEYFKRFITDEYSLFWGLIERAVSINDWSYVMEIEDTVNPIGGIKLFAMSLMIEEDVVSPYLVEIRKGVQKLGLVK